MKIKYVLWSLLILVSLTIGCEESENEQKLILAKGEMIEASRQVGLNYYTYWPYEVETPIELNLLIIPEDLVETMRITALSRDKNETAFCFFGEERDKVLIVNKILRPANENSIITKEGIGGVEFSCPPEAAMWAHSHIIQDLEKRTCWPSDDDRKIIKQKAGKLSAVICPSGSKLAEDVNIVFYE